ncbi:MAG: 4Fe-4S binding protein, partial [Candidatus Cloacimonetes bacterium]|nr:4Fe-4S binding protein [Candidatus Cloacimonadota bacterium]
AGFPTGLKWEFAYNAAGNKKYVICNADEGDPGAFMDRSILEGDPHSVIEGMIICAYAIGADEGYIYCRAEYPLALKHLQKAIIDAEEKGYLGHKIFNTLFKFKLQIKEGAGAFVCGEETALMASIEGKRGMPRIRPPFPAQSGLWCKPTNINNVETFANVSWIILNNPEKYSRYGTDKSKGTKVFALAGKIKNSGLIEVPMGMTLREVIYKVGGGMLTEKPFKGVQLGGPSGGCIPEELLDTIVDYDSINKTGAIMGSGGMVVMDTSTCMVDIAKFFLNFTQNESCGKCTFCRIGTKRMLEILTRITEGKGKMEDLETLQELSENIIKGSLCGLGQTAPNPVLTTLRYFKDEYITHIVDKRCPAGVCTALLKYEIIEDKCTGCTICARKCPVNCISGELKKVHVIDQEACIKCGFCYEVCKFDAIKKS